MAGGATERGPSLTAGGGGALASARGHRPSSSGAMPATAVTTVVGHTFCQSYHGWQTRLARQRGQFNFTFTYTFSEALGVRGGGNNGSSPTDGVRTTELGIRNTNCGVLGADRTHLSTSGTAWVCLT